MNKYFIYINDLSVSVKDWILNLLQLCEEVDIVIPRFCYHDELSVAGNCRMCLIEVMNSPKPIISCGCMLTKEMKVYTNSILVKKAREYGCSKYDMFGTAPNSNSSHPLHGLYRFKKGFGGEMYHRMGCWDYPLNKNEYVLLKSQEVKAEKFHTN